MARELVGVWILIETPGQTNQPPPYLRSVKFFGGGRWSVTYYNTNTGAILFHHGGTYTLAGNNYTERVEYANRSTTNLLNQSFKFTLNIEGDKMRQTGQGNSWNEVRQRAKYP
jgi:hypothetical protein